MSDRRKCVLVVIASAIVALLVWLSRRSQAFDLRPRNFAAAFFEEHRAKPEKAE